MGCNISFSILEKQVVTLFDKNLLTKEILECLITPIKETDCDSGGSNNLKAKDGKSFEEIICYIMSPEKFKEIEENFIFDKDYPIPETDKFINSDNGYALWESIWHNKWNIF